MDRAKAGDLLGTLIGLATSPVIAAGASKPLDALCSVKLSARLHCLAWIQVGFRLTGGPDEATE